MPFPERSALDASTRGRTALGADYAGRLVNGSLDADPAQARLVAKLAALEARLADHRLARKGSALGWLFGRKKTEPVRGLYIWGGVGRGKSLLMDLFFRHAPVKRKRRAHFHAFMADVHDRLHGMRKRVLDGDSEAEDPILPVADAIADEAWLLCFDEFFVSDIADAMILGRLFTRLFERGVVVVATSNIAPDGLYAKGLNRPLFEPFIATLKTHCEVLALADGADYRLDGLRGLTVWHAPLSAETGTEMDRLWSLIAPDAAPRDLTVKGRALALSSVSGRALRMTFDEACRAPLGPNDFLAIAESFDLLMLCDIPKVSASERNAARRFTSLIDAVYEARLTLLASAETEPAQLVPAGDEAFAFQRTASRLEEMRSADYLAASKGRGLLDLG